MLKTSHIQLIFQKYFNQKQYYFYKCLEKLHALFTYDAFLYV